MNRLPSKHLNLCIMAAIIITVCLASFEPRVANAENINVNSTCIQKLSLVQGKSKIVESAQPVQRVSVAAQEIAEVLVLSPKQIYVAGKSPGVTTVTLWRDGTVSAIYDVEVQPDISGLKGRLHDILPQEENVRVMASNDSISLSGTVSSLANLSEVVALAQTYAPKDKDGKPKLINLLEVGGVQQVMLEVRVSEMSSSLMRRMGFNFNFISSSGSHIGLSLLDNLTRLPAQGFPSNPLEVSDTVNLIYRFLAGGASWTVFIDALKDQGLLKVLAEPTLITLSGRSADFLAGGEYPIPVPQSGGSGGVVITIDYKKFGVALKFVPTVLSNGKISMEVAPEVSDLDFSNALSLQGFLVPALTTRRVSTVVELGDGQSFAIAGLLRDDVREVVRKYPALGDIPVLGALFRSSSFQSNETELVIIVTPRLVKPLDMAKQTLPTDKYIEPDDFEFYLLGRLEGKRGTVNPQTGISSQAVSKNRGGLEGDFGHIRP